MKFPRLSKTLAVFLIVACALVAFIHFGWLAALAVLMLLCLRAPVGGYACMAFSNTVDAELTLAKILDLILEEFVSAIIPVKAFSLGVTDGMTLNAIGTKEVKVGYLPAETAASKNFDAAAGDCYEIDPRELQKKTVTINRRKYQSFGITSEQAAAVPVLRNIDSFRLKARKLAVDVIADILSVVDDVAYPQESAVGAASGFDTDMMFDVRQDANDFKIPKMGRSAILLDDYFTALMKDNKDANLYGNSEVRWNAQLPRIAGMNVFETDEGLDGATDIDAGIVVYPSAILVAQAPIEPTPAIRQKLIDFRVLTHEESGLSLVYKRMADEWCDNEAEIVECTYGFAAGQSAALMRLVTA
jgi:hypothetical protein